MMTHRSALEMAKVSPQGSYVVLRVPDVEVSADFYRSLGLELTREQHGEGPVHYSFPLSQEIVCELYPLRQSSSGAQAMRLGFVVDNAAALRERLAEEGREISDGFTPGSFVVIDPSGNQVEISPKKS